jgi:phosphate transport system substrate-binding protein
MKRLCVLWLALVSCGQQQMMMMPQTLTINGSTTVFPIIDAAAKAFMMSNPNVTVTVTETDSGTGVKAAGSGMADIGMASRELKSSELSMYSTLQSVAIARDGIVVVTHPGNPVNTLTMQQVAGIYDGTTTVWSAVGGTDAGVVAYQRETGSGTRDFFDQVILDAGVPPTSVAQEQGNDGVKAAVVADVNGVGYLGFGYVDSTVQTTKLTSAGVTFTPMTSNILDGTYPISRNLNLVTKGAPSGVAKTFIDYVLSSAGQAIVTQNGFVAIR